MTRQSPPLVGSPLPRFQVQPPTTGERVGLRVNVEGGKRYTVYGGLNLRLTPSGTEVRIGDVWELLAS